MNGHEYEHYCARYLQSRGFTKVEVTKASGDQGLDIIAYKDGFKYGIQCKNYSKPVGNKAIQEAFSGAKYYKCDKAIVMTNNTFTKSARELASRLDVELWGNYSEQVVSKDMKNHSFTRVSDFIFGCLGIVVLFFGIVAIGEYIFSKVIDWELIAIIFAFIVIVVIDSWNRTFKNFMKKHHEVLEKYGIEVQSFLELKEVSVGQLKDIIEKIRNLQDVEKEDVRELRKVETFLCDQCNKIIDKYYKQHPSELVKESLYYTKPRKKKAESKKKEEDPLKWIDDIEYFDSIDD